MICNNVALMIVYLKKKKKPYGQISYCQLKVRYTYLTNNEWFHMW